MEGKRIGYLPRGAGQSVAAQIAAGFDVTATVDRVRTGGRPHVAVNLVTLF